MATQKRPRLYDIGLEKLPPKCQCDDEAERHLSEICFTLIAIEAVPNLTN